MEPHDLARWVSATEAMVSPREVGALYQRAELLARLPRRAQRVVVDLASGDDDDSIGFVVEPYATFLSYELTDLAAAEALLPSGHELVPSAMFADTEHRPCAILGAFSVHTSVFWGVRVELYLVTVDTRSDLLSWVICDYESNTINYDPGEGFSGATTSRCVVTTTHRGDVVFDVVSAERDNAVRGTVSLADGAPAALDQRLWVEGNLSVDYGGRLGHAGSAPFGLLFDPELMASATRLPVAAADVVVHGFGDGLRAREPFEVACFPYAQHFRTSSFPAGNRIRDEEGLRSALEELLTEDG